MKKILTLCAALVCGLAMNARTIYLNTGGASLWETDGANKFAVWHWQGSGEGQWTGWMTSLGNNIWSVDIPDSSNQVIFCRFNTAATSPSWGADMWNQTDDLEPGSNNLYTITGWGKGEGNWSTYGGGGDQPGGGGQGSGDYDYYIRGYINNKDMETPTAEELFEKGILADFSFTGNDGKSYFYIMACEKGQLVGKDYMLKEYIEGGTHVTLYDKEATSSVQKWGVPAGKVTFYLYDNGDGTLSSSFRSDLYP